MNIEEVRKEDKVVLAICGSMFLFILIAGIIIPVLVSGGILPPEADIQQIIECVIVYDRHLDGDEENPTLVEFARIHYNEHCVPIGFDK